MPIALGNYRFPNSLEHAVLGAPSRFHGTNQTPASGRLGYTIPGSVNTNEINGLGRLLNEYAGPSSPVVDYSNEPGVTYFLLNRVPGSQFYIQEVAQTEPAQNKFISDLKASRPPVVILNNKSFGYPNIDGVPDSVRTYSVSDYIFTHYTPLVNYQGQLLVLRNDLVASAPPLPQLPLSSRSVPWLLSIPVCSLGFIPNFFTPPSDISSLPIVKADVKQVSRTTGTSSGWAIDPRTSRPVSRVVAVNSKGQIVGSANTGIFRPDVGNILRKTQSQYSGFSMTVPPGKGEKLTYYGLTQDGIAFLLVPGVTASTVNTENLPTSVNVEGRIYLVRATYWAGSVELSGTGFDKTLRIDFPRGTDIASYPWLRISNGNHLDSSNYALTNSAPGLYDPLITFNWSSRGANSLVVPVNACAQWHSHQSNSSLYLRISNDSSRTPVGVTLIGGKAP